MIAYLLGELPEAENAGIEEQYLASEAAFAPLRAIEAELYDAYARDALPIGRRRAFERKFLATPEQRQRLEFSRALLNHQQPQLRPAEHWRGARVAVLIGVAAALLLAIALWWPTGGVNQQPVAQTAPANSPVVAAFTIGAGVTRAGGAEPTLDIPVGADVVRISAGIEQDLRPAYGAVLRTPEGAEIWRSDPTGVIVEREMMAVIVEVPASVLNDGHYILTLYATNPNGVIEDLADYAFLALKSR